MRKSLFFICLLLPFIALSQSKEKSFFGGQIGLLEARIYNEFSISSSFSFQSSIGLPAGIDNSDFYFSSKVQIGPKWNYNLNKRRYSNKNTKYNSSNYIALNMSYTPNWATLKDYENRLIERIGVIPTFGIKRNFIKHLNYELFFGIGYEHYLNTKTKTTNSSKAEVVVAIGALIGFDF